MAAPTLNIGQIVGHYRLVERIGSGGMGIVYRAHDERLDRDVAVKVLHPGAVAGQSDRRHFRKEALALSRLNHPNIETVYDFDTQNGLDFLVVEYIPGSSLDHTVIAGPLLERDVGALGTQLADGLAAAHEKGILHRDLKPGNLRVTPDGRLKILDFGLAKLAHPTSDTARTETMTEDRPSGGTLPYMAPEQVLGERLDPRADIYAVGAVLYELAAGRRPFPEAHSSRLADSILHQQAVSPRIINPRISSELERIILKCLEKDPNDRYQSAKELGVDLRHLAASSSRIQPLPVFRAKPARNRRMAILGLVVCLLMAGIFLAPRVRNWGGPFQEHPGVMEIQSLAVLPLKNISADPAQEYFSDGMTEALITQLSKIHALRVISRASVMQYRDTQKPAHQVGQELAVQAIISGSVLRAGQRVRIAIEVVDCRTDGNLWAGKYEGDMTDILDLQSRVAQEIAAQIQVQLTPREHENLARNRAVDPRAYENYLQGRFYWNKRTPQDLLTGTEYFQKAIQIDPGYPLAYAGIADSYILLEDQGELSPQTAIPLAKAAAEKALELDDSLAEAHVSLAAVKWTYDWDLEGAQKEFQRALQLDPSYATAREWYGLYLAQVNQVDAGIAQMHRARELDPLSLIIQVNLGRCYYFARRYDRAVTILQQLEQKEPNFWIVHAILGQTYLAMGRLNEALLQLERARALLPDNPRNLGVLGDAYGRAGRKREALKLAQELAQLSHRRYVSPVLSAMIYAGLGQQTQALAFLEQGYSQRSDWMPLLRIEPEFDSLRANPDFERLLHRIGEPPQ